jgi:hypothetical protein
MNITIETKNGCFEGSHKGQLMHDIVDYCLERNSEAIPHIETMITTDEKEERYFVYPDKEINNFYEACELQLELVIADQIVEQSYVEQLRSDYYASIL